MDRGKYESRRRALLHSASMASPSKAALASERGRLDGAIERHMRASAVTEAGSDGQEEAQERREQVKRAPIGAKYSLPPEFDLDAGGGATPAVATTAPVEDFLEVAFLCVSLQVRPAAPPPLHAPGSVHSPPPHADQGWTKLRTSDPTSALKSGIQAKVPEFSKANLKFQSC